MTPRASNPWPDTMPTVPEDWRGWLCANTARALLERLSPETKWVVECGTWTGCSARWIVENGPNTMLICIDTWQGSPEHHTNPDWACRLPTLYETCQRNLWPWRDRIVMLRRDSLVGLGEVFAAGIVPDLIYLDSKHTVGRVAAELAVCAELFPTAAIVGDDYNNAAVAKAADEHAKLMNRTLVNCRDAFAFDRRTA